MWQGNYRSQNDPLYLYAPQYFSELIKSDAKDSVFSDAIKDLRVRLTCSIITMLGTLLTIDT